MVQCEIHCKSFEELKTQLSNPDGVSEVLKKVMAQAQDPITEIGYFHKEENGVDNADAKCFPYRLLRASRMTDNFCSCEQLIELFASKIKQILSQVLYMYLCFICQTLKSVILNLPKCSKIETPDSL